MLRVRFHVAIVRSASRFPAPVLWSFDLPWLRAEAQRDAAWCRRLLPRVSRTFALSIGMLPPSLRDAVGDAYLLCRIVDSVEDDRACRSSSASRLFDAFDAVLADDATDEKTCSRSRRARRASARRRRSASCARARARCFRAFRALDRSQRDAIRPQRPRDVARHARVRDARARRGSPSHSRRRRSRALLLLRRRHRRRPADRSLRARGPRARRGDARASSSASPFRSASASSS